MAILSDAMRSGSFYEEWAHLAGCQGHFGWGLVTHGHAQETQRSFKIGGCLPPAVRKHVNEPMKALLANFMPFFIQPLVTLGLTGAAPKENTEDHRLVRAKGQGPRAMGQGPRAKGQEGLF